jgi:uncharacterized protein (DUF1501 family)
MDRRQFLTSVSAASIASSLNRFAFAQTAPAGDYKALVCIFLFGGNDGNNMVVPLDASNYSAYAATRTEASGLNLSRSALLPFKVGNMRDSLGLHPQMKGVHALAEAGKVAVLANTGPLVGPTTKADYLAYKNRPDNLFSHSDQQLQWQTSVSTEPSKTGWGGRLADAVAPLNGNIAMPVITSIAGSPLFITGLTQSPLTLPSSGGFGLAGFGPAAAPLARENALKEILALTQEHTLSKAASSLTQQAMALSSIINPVITANNTAITSLFTTTGNSLAPQLLQVAKLISAREALGVKRQLFFVSMGGYDTHTSQLQLQADLLDDLSAAMKSFYDATVQMGVANNVTTFTQTDFGRTLKPAAGGAVGTDHAWGNHHLIMGGAVNGGLFGTMPTLELNGPDDVTKEGRWLPTTSIDQYAATLAQWFGVPTAQIPQVAPNINAYTTKNLGFLGA